MPTFGPMDPGYHGVFTGWTSGDESTFFWFSNVDGLRVLV